MFKKIFSLLICLVLCLSFAGCKKKSDTLSVDSATPEVSTVVPVTYKNPLTGESGLSKEVSVQRPVAIMVNNISIAQPVQTGLNQADIIYETEVEGGITRLLAVYQDFKSVKRIGTVRSSRYVYIDLAAGHNALYAYHGIDKRYAKPHLGVVDSVLVSTNNGGTRISNGLAYEHTLYASGSKVWNTMKSAGYKTTTSNTDTWQTFADEENPVQFENTASSVTVAFSGSYKTTLTYDAATGRYTRLFNGTQRKDYNTKEPVTVKNVFVLNTPIQDYPDKYHRQIDLSSGSGYYCVNGTYTKINWRKGDTHSAFKFTNTDGTPLTVNPGNSWVCIADNTRSQPTFQ